MIQRNGSQEDSTLWENAHKLIVYFVYYVDDGDDIPSFDVEVDYIIVCKASWLMSQQLFSSNHRQLGIALRMILAALMLQINYVLHMSYINLQDGPGDQFFTSY
jgi:hypothetical protein